MLKTFTAKYYVVFQIVVKYGIFTITIEMYDVYTRRIYTLNLEKKAQFRKTVKPRIMSQSDMFVKHWPVQNKP